MRLALVVTLLVSISTNAAAAGFFVQGTGYFTKIGGELSEENEERRNELDLGDDLDFGSDFTGELKAGISGGRHRFSVAAAVFDHEAEASRRGFEFDGTEFDVSASLLNQLRWVEVEYGFRPITIPIVKLELVAGVRFYDYKVIGFGEANFGGISLPQRAELAADSPVPHLGVAVEVKPLPLLIFRGSARGMKGGIDDTDGTSIDLEASAGISLVLVEIGATVRRFDLRVSLDDDRNVFDLNYTAVGVYVRLKI